MNNKSCKDIKIGSSVGEKIGVTVGSRMGECFLIASGKVGRFGSVMSRLGSVAASPFTSKLNLGCDL